MKTSEVLNRAADLIEERGWIAGKGWEHEKGGPLCLEGGILAAIGGSWFAGDHYRCPAYRAVKEYLGGSPWLWNDSLAHDYMKAAIDGGDFHDIDRLRTEGAEHAKREVIATLRAAAVIEAAKETADEREAVSA